LKIIARNGKEVYSGSLKDLTQINQRKIDSVQIQLSTGSSSFEKGAKIQKKFIDIILELLLLLISLSAKTVLRFKTD
jgi:hypothetical protein